MGVRDVKGTIARVTVDRTVDLQDAKAIVDAAGKRMSDGELTAMVEDLNAGIRGDVFELTDEAYTYLNKNIGSVAQLKQQVTRRNAMVERRAELLEVQERARLDPTRATESLAGTEIPAAVKDAMRAALDAGAEPYDVSTLRAPERDESADGGWKVEGVFTPYPQDIEATGTMRFSNTEITPQKLKEDMETVQTFKQFTGTRTETYTDPRTGKTDELQVAEYEEVTRRGTGNVLSHYDHASHSELDARGPSGQKWANNYAILSDGSLHALPAMRRTEDQPGLILTNPSLARGQRLMFNGHITIRAGVVTDIGMSGRLQKLAAKGEHKFANPIPILKAWGFEIAPGLQLRFEGSGERPPSDGVTVG